MMNYSDRNTLTRIRETLSETISRLEHVGTHIKRSAKLASGFS